MCEIIVIIEKETGNFVAYTSEEVHFHLKDPDLDELKKKALNKVYESYKRKKRKNSESDVESAPRVVFRYNVQKLLLDVNQMVSKRSLARYSKMNSITLSYYAMGERNATERTFLKLLDGVKKIIQDLDDIVAIKKELTLES